MPCTLTLSTEYYSYMYMYLFLQMVAWQQFAPIQLVRFLRMVIAMFRNQTLFLDPYVSIMFFWVIINLIFNPCYCRHKNYSNQVVCSVLKVTARLHTLAF